MEAAEFHRRPGLLTREAAALAALSPLQMRRNRARGIPRRTAGHWTSLARVVEPLDAARAGLHNGDDVRYRRAAAHAVAVVLAHCAPSGSAWWEWTAWDWAARPARRSAPGSRARPRRRCVRS